MKKSKRTKFLKKELRKIDAAQKRIDSQLGGIKHSPSALKRFQEIQEDHPKRIIKGFAPADGKHESITGFVAPKKKWDNNYVPY